MAYQALYREWRPQKFSELVGQEHVSRTLRGALMRGWINHAYLFSGPRGTGKTSAARILAKSVNCANCQDGEPCNTCPSCQAISGGQSLDVVEIDAASNRGIDEIRDLREKVRFSPAVGRYRVYIIDEVHMLTNEAFNALLKTLEEPPSHIIFVLATTEVHKVPPTILSRCQRFDFRRIAPPLVFSHLKEIAHKLGIAVEDEALWPIVRAAEGSLRDALSLFDQCMVLGGGRLQREEVALVLGSLPEEILQETVAALRGGEAIRLICLIDRVVNEGKDLRRFLRELIAYCRDLLVVRMEGEERVPLLVSAGGDAEGLARVAADWKTDELVFVIRQLTVMENELRWLEQPRWLLEALLFDLQEKLQDDTATKGYLYPQEISGRIAELEEKLQRVLESRGTRHLPGERRTEGDAASGTSLPGVIASWPRVLEVLRRRSVRTQALVLEAEPVSLEGDVLTLAFKKGRSFHRQQLEEAGEKALVEEALRQVLGKNISIRCVMQEERGGRH